jgi:hemoglobin-like flavoprotein
MADSAQLLRESWRHAVAAGDAFPKLFYALLFDRAPAVRALFPVDMREQRRHLVATLGTVVNADSLDDQAVLDRLHALGRDHRRYGATGPGYEAVGSCLVLALKGISPEWTDEHGAAWEAAYKAVAGAMQDADHEAAAAPRWLEADVLENVADDLDLVNLQLDEPDAWPPSIQPGAEVWARRADRPASWVRAHLFVDPDLAVRLTAPIVDDDLDAVALSFTPVGARVALAPLFAQEGAEHG